METQIIIVEDSEFFGKLVKRQINNALGLQVIWYKSFAEAEKGISNLTGNSIALLDFHLPDVLNGEIIDLFMKKNIPSIVMTGTFSADLQELIWS